MKQIGSDWLSPVVVKELRQGMRGRVFESSFLVLQAAMMFATIVGVMARATTTDMSFVNGLFWTMNGVLLAGVMPLRGFSAIQSEAKAKTLELVFLTRLTAWRITAGKWAALNAQTFLLASAILPYVILRYFLGGVNLLGDLTILGSLLAVSALLSAVTVGLSATESRLLRFAPVLVLFLGFNGVSVLLRASGRSPWSGGSTTYWWMLALLGPVVLLYMLEFGAGRIAPLAENHATPKRLLALLAIGTIPLLALWLPTGAGEYAVLVLVFVTVVCIDALCEEPRTLPGLYTPFVKRGRWAELTGLLLYPGWHSGVLFTLLTIPAATWLVVHLSGGKWEQDVLQLMCTLLAALFWPLALTLLFVPRTRKPGLWYFGIQLVTVIITTFSIVAMTAIRTDAKDILGFMPTAALLFLIAREGKDYWLLQTIFTGSVTLVIVVVKFLKPWRLTRAAAAQARAELAPPSS